MFAFVFELLLEVLLQGIGHSLVYVCTLGQKRVGDDVDKLIGLGFILALILLTAIVI